MTGVTEFTQKGRKLTVTRAKLEHQRRQIRRREARSHDATGQNVAFAGIEGERYTYSDVERAVRRVNTKWSAT
jgi:hypothetical protein